MHSTRIKRRVQGDDMEGAAAYVTTITEAARTWGKHRKSVEMAILRGRLKARQTDQEGFWLIDVDSLIELWGKPWEEPATTPGEDISPDDLHGDMAPLPSPSDLEPGLPPALLPLALRDLHCEKCESADLNITPSPRGDHYRVLCRKCGAVRTIFKDQIEMK